MKRLAVRLATPSIFLLVLCAALMLGTAGAAYAGKIGGVVRSSAGRPLANVSVSVFTLQDPDHVGWWNWNLYRSTKTDSRGRYAVAGLPTNTYHLLYLPATASRATNAFEAYTSDDAGAYGQAYGDDIKLRAGQSRLHIDAKMGNGPSRIDGTVRDSDGKAVAGAEVMLQYQAPARKDLVFSARANAAGAFALTGLPIGSFELSAVDPAGMHVGVFFEPMPVTARRQALSHDFLLGPAGKVRGKVEVPAGNSAAGVRAQVWAWQETDPGDGQWTELDEAKTDNSGDFVVGGLPPGDVRIGFVDTPSYRYPRTWLGGAPVIDTSTVVTVAAGQTVTASSQRLSTSVGNVHGVVTAAAGPLPSLNVRVFAPVGAAWYDATLNSDVVNPAVNGSYTLPGLMYGTYRVLLENNDVPSPYLWFGNTYDENLAQTVTVSSPGGAAADFVFAPYTGP